MKETIEDPENSFEIVKKYSHLEQVKADFEKQKEMIQPLLERNRRKIERSDPEKMRFFNFQVEEAERDMMGEQLKK